MEPCSPCPTCNAEWVSLLAAAECCDPPLTPADLTDEEREALAHAAHIAIEATDRDEI